VHVRVIEYVSD